MDSSALAERLCEVIHVNTERVFETMLHAPIGRLAGDGAPAVKPGDDGVVSLIGLTGSWTGSGCICCSGSLARLLSGRLLMTTFETVDAEVLDAMGELANMIIGNVKEDMAPSLGPLGISTPTVIHGSGLQARSVHGQGWSTVAFVCEGEPFEVRVRLMPAGAA